jgi:hypothetical protein
MTDHRFVTTMDGAPPSERTFLDSTGPCVWRHTCSTCGKSMTDAEMIADGMKYGGRNFTPDCPGRTAWDHVSESAL